MQISKSNKKFLIYISKYLGVALVSGSVVHMGTLEVGFYRYLLLAFVGILLMLTGNIYEAKDEGIKINVNYLLLLTTLALSTGFLSGGVQHYLDNPFYAGSLLAIGLLMTYITFNLKEKFTIRKKSLIIIIIISLIILLLSVFIFEGTISHAH